MAMIAAGCCPMCGAELLWVYDREVLNGGRGPRFLVCRPCQAVLEPNRGISEEQNNHKELI